MQVIDNEYRIGSPSNTNDYRFQELQPHTNGDTSRYEWDRTRPMPPRPIEDGRDGVAGGDDLHGWILPPIIGTARPFGPEGKADYGN
jgi:hypothetical protein